MGYRVDYQPVKKIRGAEKRRCRRAAMTGLCLLLFFLLVNGFWPQGAQVLRGILFPGDMAVAASALEEMTVELKAGEELVSAFRSFLSKLLREARFG